MFKLTDEQIEKATNWWADAMVNPRFDGLSNEERRDPQNDSYQLAEVMATVSHKNPTNEQLGVFKASLREQLKSDEYAIRGLHVDYGPDSMLCDAAKAAGIDITMSLFPWKTNMYFRDDGSVTVSAGYRAPVECL